MGVRLTFLGGAGTVTGSKYLAESGQHRILIDCGLFQGFKALRLRNWARFPIDPRSINAVVLTHAHIDHSGYLPLLVREGFAGPIFCSSATLAYCEILLPDAGFLHERDADYANRHGFSKHKPALPLYTEADAIRALARFKAVSIGAVFALPGGATVLLQRAGHILGATTIELKWDGVTVVFSSDLGRYDDPITVDPVSVPHADYLLVESTYGDRRHPNEDPEDTLGEIISKTVGRGGTVVIPAFAVGRAQSLLFHLERLKSANRIPNVPIYLDSPMAIDASDLLCKYLDDHRLSETQCRTSCAVAHYVRTVDESKALNADPMPKVIVSASGMATGGRVLHHIKRYAPERKNTILFAGFQAGGTRGAAMIGGAEAIKIHGEYIRIRAEVGHLDALSAHADSDEIMRWLGGFKRAPRATYIVHGEPTASDALRHRIDEELGWGAHVPDHGQMVELS